MAYAAIAGAAEWVRPQHHKPGRYVDARTGERVPPAMRRAKGATAIVQNYLPVLAGLIAEGEVVDEDEALERLWRDGGVSQEPGILVDGTSPTVARLVSEGYWRWADAKAGTLCRRTPRSAPVVVSRWKPRPSADPATRDLRRELDDLRRQVTGNPSRPSVHLEDGHRLVQNPTSWPLTMRLDDVAGQWTLLPEEVVEVDDETAAEWARPGVLRVIGPDELAELMVT